MRVEQRRIHTSMHNYNRLPQCTTTTSYHNAQLQQVTAMLNYNKLPQCTTTTSYRNAQPQQVTAMLNYNKLHQCTTTTSYSNAQLQPVTAMHNYNKCTLLKQLLTHKGISGYLVYKCTCVRIFVSNMTMTMTA